MLRRALRKLPRDTLGPDTLARDTLARVTLARARMARAGSARPAPTEEELTMQANPIRRIGSWAELSPEQRRRAVTRGLDKIFDPALREDIARLIEDVRLGNLG